jgi:hypothetical protein
MKKTSTAFIVFLAIGLIACRVYRLAYAMAGVHDSQVILAQYEWDNVQFHISLADLKSAIEKLPKTRRDDLISKNSRAEYLEELTNEKLKVLDAIGRNLDTDASLLKSVEEYQQQRMVQRLIEIEVDEKVSYTEAELKAYYEAHKEDYVAKAESHATCISLTSRHRAQEVLDEIKKRKRHGGTSSGTFKKG